jgi:hypothetical protein
MLVPDNVVATLRTLPQEGVTRQRRALAGALALALLWSLLWGGWHRTLHGDPLASAQARQHALTNGAVLPVGGHTAAAPTSSQQPAAHDATGHEAGSEDCRLLDQLLLGDALVFGATLAAVLPVETVACPSVDSAAVAARETLSYQARAPPRS